MEKVQKPASVAKKELEETIINAINGSGLPAFAISQILQNALAQLQNLEAKQYEADKAEYERKLKEAEGSEKKSKRELSKQEKDALIRHAKTAVEKEETVDGDD